VWTGSGGRLERAVSVPDALATALSLTHDEETVVARAGVSGSAWLAIWLPQVLAGRSDAKIRAAPITHSGRLRGPVVAVRPAAADAFTPDDHTMPAQLARQPAPALPHPQLDS